jgi:DNA-directed RNA polymerase specialized sigma subunit
MTESDAKRMHKNALRAAAKYRFFGEEGEEIAQEVMCRYATGQHQKQSVQKAVIDVIRSRYGDSRWKRTGDKGALLNCLPFLERHGGYSSKLDEKTALDEKLGDLQGTPRVVMYLLFFWGLTMKEIAHCLGLTQGRISQITTETIEAIRRKK